jgi:hypothetical protein
MILAALVSAHAMMSAGTLTCVPTNTGTVAVHHVSNTGGDIINSVVSGTVKIPSVVSGTAKIPSVVSAKVKIPSVVPSTVNQQKISKVTTNEPGKPIRKEISPEALRALNERRQAALDKEMKSRMLQSNPTYTINPNHDGDHWSITK